MWGGAENYPCMYNGAEADLVFMPKINVWQYKENVNLQVVDFAQKLAIYDYRHEEINKQAFIKNFCKPKVIYLFMLTIKSLFGKYGYRCSICKGIRQRRSSAHRGAV